MAPLRSILFALAVVSSSAFIVPSLPSSFGLAAAPAAAIRPPSSLFAGDSDKEGGAAIAKPALKTEIKTKTVTRKKQASKKRVRSSDPVQRRDEDFEDAPMYKVMLLGDESYDQTHVIERLVATLEDMDEGQASTVYGQAQRSGKAMCGKYPFEHAEMYKEQLIRSDPMIYSDIEEENNPK